MQFFVLPDNTAAASAIEAFTGRDGVTELRHASGRPWIVGHWPDDELVWASAGTRRIAVLGHAAVTGADLERTLGALRSLRDLDDFARRVPGSFHLIASLDGEVRVQGSLTTVRQVFHAGVAGATLAADRPDALARLSGAGLDEELLAGTLLAPAPPWPLGERCLWQGVRSLPIGTYLELDTAGRHRTVRWWTPPEQVPLAEGAARVRTALADAVAARTRGRTMLSADLSGGMDSTSLCFLAAGRVDRLLALRQPPSAPGDEDGVWADRAAARLPGVDYLVLRAGDPPSGFADLLEPDPDLEAPFALIRSRALFTDQARRLAAAGSTVHLTGYGGDELFLTDALYLHALARRRPLRALRSLRAHRALFRWPLGPPLRGLLDREPFGAWLGGHLADSLDAPIEQVHASPTGGWGGAYRMPVWATPDALESVRRSLRALGGSGIEPLSPVRGLHAALQSVRWSGETIRRTDRLTSRHGVRFQAPFLDDRVLEAALSIDYADCLDISRYKPGLVEAMRGVVPDANLGRRTKTESSAAVYAGLRRNRRDLLELCGDMHLARLGLVDPSALRATLTGLPPNPLYLIPLLPTLACEVWLRSLAARSGRSVPYLEGVRS
ncbi:asparagine synthase-related protein [Spirillospora sp. CA-253888]